MPSLGPSIFRQGHDNNLKPVTCGRIRTTPMMGVRLGLEGLSMAAQHRQQPNRGPALGNWQESAVAVGKGVPNSSAVTCERFFNEATEPTRSSPEGHVNTCVGYLSISSQLCVHWVE